MANQITIYAPGTKVDLGFELSQKVGFVNRVIIGPAGQVEYEVIVWDDGARSINWHHAHEVSLHHEDVKQSPLLVNLARS